MYIALTAMAFGKLLPNFAAFNLETAKPKEQAHIPASRLHKMHNRIIKMHQIQISCSRASLYFAKMQKIRRECVLRFAGDMQIR